MFKLVLNIDGSLGCGLLNGGNLTFDLFEDVFFGSGVNHLLFGSDEFLAIEVQFLGFGLWGFGSFGFGFGGTAHPAHADDGRRLKIGKKIKLFYFRI